MSVLSARFASAIVVSVVAGLPVGTAPFGAVAATDNCLSTPNSDTPPGKHWYYRIDHPTGRHCWYLRGEDEKPRVVPEFATSPSPARRAETPATSSVANARAELPAGAMAPPSADTSKSSSPAASTSPQLATPWPAPSAIAAIGPAAKPSAIIADDDQSNGATTAPSVVMPQPAAATPAPERESASVQKLFVVVVAALALAGLTGSAVYRLAGARRRARLRRDRWPTRDAVKSPQRAALAPSIRPAMPAWEEPPMREAEPTPHSIAEIDEPEEITSERVELIEEFLGRLTKQLQAERASVVRPRTAANDESPAVISPAAAAAPARTWSGQSGVRASAAQR